MTMDVKHEILRLRAELEHHNQLYYVNAAPEITVAHRNIDLLCLCRIKHRGSPPEGQC